MRLPPTRPPTYASRVPSRYDDAAYDTEGLAGLSKPRDVRISDGSGWSGLTMLDNGHESVVDSEEAYDNRAKTNSLVPCFRV